MFNFDEKELKDKLAGVANVRRSLFAAMVATRLSVGYEFYAGGDSGKFNAALDYLWKSLGAEVSVDEVGHYVDEAIALIPGESEGPRRFAAQADDAAAALAYALRSLIDPSPQEAAWAARRAYESADNLVIQRTGVEIGGEAENRVIEDPLIQSELERQQFDVEVAMSSPLDGTTLGSLRSECHSWGTKFFSKISS